MISWVHILGPQGYTRVGVKECSSHTFGLAPTQGSALLILIHAIEQFLHIFSGIELFVGWRVASYIALRRLDIGKVLLSQASTVIAVALFPALSERDSILEERVDLISGATRVRRTAVAIDSLSSTSIVFPRDIVRVVVRAKISVDVARVWNIVPRGVELLGLMMRGGVLTPAMVATPAFSIGFAGTPTEAARSIGGASVRPGALR